MVAEDIESTSARVRIKVQDADSLDLLEGLERGEGQSIELAEAVP